MQRFTAYRRAISGRDTHNEKQKNPDDVPQFEGVIWTDGTVCGARLETGEEHERSGTRWNTRALVTTEAGQ